MNGVRLTPRHYESFVNNGTNVSEKDFLIRMSIMINNYMLQPTLTRLATKTLLSMFTLST